MQMRSRENGAGSLCSTQVLAGRGWLPGGGAWLPGGRAWVLGVLALAFLPGCDYRQLQQDREALMRQNQALQAQNSSVMDENDRLGRRPAPVVAPPAPVAPVAPPPSLAFDPAGFESIQGLEVDNSRAEQVKVSVPGDLLFAPGQATLTAAAKKTVDEVAGVLNGKHAGSTVGLIGHTDSDPIRKSQWASNEALSLARAEAVADQLAAAGVARGRMETRGVGAQQPRGGKKSADRRVEIVVSR